MKIPGPLRWHQREMLKAVDPPEGAANSDMNGKEDKKENCSLLVTSCPLGPPERGLPRKPQKGSFSQIPAPVLGLYQPLPQLQDHP